MKIGTRIQVRGFDWSGNETYEDAKIARDHKSWKREPERHTKFADWHTVEYADGGRVMVHASGFRVIDNHA